MRLTVLGCRGSMAVGGASFAEFGGATSCYLVECGDDVIILDAGTGLMRAPLCFATMPHIVCTHLHMDHLLGLGMYGRLSKAGTATRLYLPVPEHEGPKQVLARLFGPPWWPLSLTEYGSDLEVLSLPEHLVIGTTEVSAIEGSHPGGCKVLRVRHGGKTLVYATDFEVEPVAFERLCAFAQDADLVLFDGQYTQEELASHRGFGHATAEAGMELMRACSAKRLVLVHFDPSATDDALVSREKAIGDERVSFAREGMVVEL